KTLGSAPTFLLKYQFHQPKDDAYNDGDGQQQAQRSGAPARPARSVQEEALPLLAGNLRRGVPRPQAFRFFLRAPGRRREPFARAGRARKFWQRLGQRSGGMLQHLVAREVGGVIVDAGRTIDGHDVIMRGLEAVWTAPAQA